MSLGQKGEEIFDKVAAAAPGERTKSAALGCGDLGFVPWQIAAVMSAKALRCCAAEIPAVQKLPYDQTSHWLLTCSAASFQTGTEAAKAAP
jgi:hypothetical protein